MERIEYARTDGGCPQFVVYEFDDHGREEFKERDVRADEWISYTPSDEERHVAHHIRDDLRKENGALRMNYVGKLRIDWVR